VLLIGSSDSKDCCAKNYERTLFRDKKVIKFAEAHAVSYRLDRSGSAGTRFYSQHSLNKKKPAVLVFDTYGDLLYAAQKCEDPRDVVKKFKSVRRLAQKRESLVEKNAAKLLAIKDLVKAKRYPEALSSISRVNKKSLILPLRDRLKSHYRSVSSAAKKKLRAARKLVKKKEYGKAIKKYQDVVKTFGRIKSAKKKARKGVERARKLKAEHGENEVSSRDPKETRKLGAVAAGSW
jgi:hypothetical protein